MPVSNVNLVPMVVDAVVECAVKHKVRKVLDLGCGAGFYGAVIRQYLDHIHNRFNAGEQVEITGIEACSNYKNPNWDHYKQIINKPWNSAKDILKGEFDLVLACDVLEHMDSDKARATMQELYNLTKKYLIVTTPTTFREQWQPEKPWEDEFQQHKCLITRDIIESLFPRTLIKIATDRSVYMAVIKQEFLAI